MTIILIVRFIVISRTYASGTYQLVHAYCLLYTHADMGKHLTHYPASYIYAHEDKINLGIHLAIIRGKRLNI